MREILFRGKCVDDGEWVYGVPIFRKNICYMVEGLCICDKCYCKQAIYNCVHPESIGQYTGLKDKNGKRIFEGDILKYALQVSYNCYLDSLEFPEDYEGCDYSDIFTVAKVVYGLEYGYPAFDLSDHDFDCNGLSELSESMNYHFEVIGNIHDNPELLEVEHDR